MKRIITLTIATVMIAVMSYSVFLMSDQQSRLGHATRYFNNSIHVIRSHDFNQRIRDYYTSDKSEYKVVVTEDPDHYIFTMSFEFNGKTKTLTSKVNK